MSCVYCGVDDGPIKRACRCSPKNKKFHYEPQRVCIGCGGEGVIEIDYGGHTCLIRETCKKCKGTGEFHDELAIITGISRHQIGLIVSNKSRGK